MCACVRVCVLRLCLLLFSFFVAADDKATIDFVGWGGGLGAADGSAAEGVDAHSPVQASFDLAAEIDALPARPGCV